MGAIAKTIAEEFELKQNVAGQIISSLAATAKGGQIQWQVRLPGLLHDQDPLEAGYQGWPEGGLRQDDDGEGEACKDRREGVPRCGFEEEHLRCVSSSVCQF